MVGGATCIHKWAPAPSLITNAQCSFEATTPFYWDPKPPIHHPSPVPGPRCHGKTVWRKPNAHMKKVKRRRRTEERLNWGWRMRSEGKKHEEGRYGQKQCNFQEPLCWVPPNTAAGAPETTVLAHLGLRMDDSRIIESLHCQVTGEQLLVSVQACKKNNRFHMLLFSKH